MEVWQTIILVFGGNVALFAVLGYLSKSLLSQLLLKDIEGFKAILKSESEVASQKLRHDLEKASIEHKVRFSKLHEKRAEVIAKLYSLLVQAYWDLSSFVSPIDWAGEPNKQEKYVAAMNSVADFYRYFDKHRIYLPEALCLQIDEYVQEMRSRAIGFGVYVKYDDATITDHAYENKHKAWEQAWEYFQKKVPETKTSLENELRDILGGIS